MENFLNTIIEGEKVELTLDSKIFTLDVALRAAYNLLNLGYFFFKLDGVGNIIVQCTKKKDASLSPDELLMNYSDELLSTLLRHKLETDNKVIRERIVSVAISNSVDARGFVQIDTDNIGGQQNQEQGQIDFDKDIDDILKEIENDPELKIDEGEIERILKEIESETHTQENQQKPEITLDANAIQNAKEKFQNR